MSRTANLLLMLVALAIGLVLASLLAPLPTIPAKADPGWEIQIIDSAANVRAGESSSIALDSSGNPHISYTYVNTTFWAGDLKYASYNGTHWNTETVVDSDPSYLIYSTSLALDSSDQPHISFYESDQVHSEGSFKYASYNGTDWQIQTIESGVGSTGGADKVSSIAIDSFDNPHVSFSRLQTTPTVTHIIKYASYNGTDWNTEVVNSNCSMSNSLAFDSLDVPHISYNQDPTGAYLGYATYNGTSWNTTQVTTAWYRGKYNSIAIDSSDYPHISHTYVTPSTYIGALNYAYMDGSGWHNGTADSVGDTGYWTSLALDGADHPHISYIIDVPPNDSVPFSLKYASYNGTAWNTETVDTESYFAATSLALGSCGYPHISYYDETGPSTGDLTYARFIPAPGLAVSKGGSAVSKVGDNVTYWVNISNTGDVPLQKVSVNDSLVAGIDGLFSPTLSVGASENRTYTYTVQGGDPNPLLNTVTAVYGDAYAGACFSNQSVSDNHSVTLVHPGIEVTKTPVNPVSKVGDDVTFTITIENTGDCTLIRDNVSDNLSVSPDPNTYAPFASIPAYSSVSGNFTYTVQDTDPDPLVNVVTVHYHPDGLTTDYSDNATCSVDLRHPDILVTKGVAAGAYGAGDNVTYLLAIHNTSTDITLIKDSVTDSLAGDITSLFSDNITVETIEGHSYIYTVKATDPDPLMNDVTVHYHPEGLTNDIFDSTYTTVFLTPTITSLNPSQSSQGQTLNIVITGSQLNRVNAVDFGAGITVNSITVDSPTQITANIRIGANAASGPRDVTVTNPTGSDILIGGFTVQQSLTTGRRASPSTNTSHGAHGPAQIELQYLSVRPQQTMAGQPVTITTNVVNTGYEAGSYNVALKINGHMEQSRMVSVGPQGTQPVKFTVTRSQPGTYTVNIDEQRGSFIVTGAGSSPDGQTGKGILFIAATAVIAILVLLLITVTRRRFQDY
ncbi:MAG: hypothetical protein JSV54_05210 [Chloroflexota bacterium]|nr:MAG: hypothetical protein JSV54_05210 [Chloroflexota bacterium]